MEDQSANTTSLNTIARIVMALLIVPMEKKKDIADSVKEINSAFMTKIKDIVVVVEEVRNFAQTIGARQKPTQSMSDWMNKERKSNIALSVS